MYYLLKKKRLDALRFSKQYAAFSTPEDVCFVLCLNYTPNITWQHKPNG